MSSEALANMRRVCVGFSSVRPILTEKLWKETMDLAQAFKLSENSTARVRGFMSRAEQGRLSECKCCGLSLSVLLILPCCGSLICPDCVNTDVYEKGGSEYIECLMCTDSFLVDQFQRIQPGFKFDWLDNLKNNSSKVGGKAQTQTGTSPSSPTTSARVFGSAAPAGAAAAPLDVPVIRPPRERQRTRKFGDGHVCTYDHYSVDGTCTLCLTEHDGCNLLNKTKRCRVCHRAAVECPAEESKSSYLVEKLFDLAKSKQPANYAKAADRPLKVIVFSQYRKALNLVGDRLLGRYGTACVAEYWGRYRTQELRKFKLSNECFCMTLGNDGSEGLDLSFVTRKLLDGHFVFS
jgi:hypothetical protein